MGRHLLLLRPDAGCSSLWSPPLQHTHSRAVARHQWTVRPKACSLKLAATSLNGSSSAPDGAWRTIGSSEEAAAFWASAYQQLSQEARSVGVPGSAIPKLRSDASVEDIMAAHRHLEAILASFLSSGL